MLERVRDVCMMYGWMDGWMYSVVGGQECGAEQRGAGAGDR